MRAVKYESGYYQLCSAATPHMPSHFSWLTATSDGPAGCASYYQTAKTDDVRCDAVHLGDHNNAGRSLSDAAAACDADSTWVARQKHGRALIKNVIYLSF